MNIVLMKNDQINGTKNYCKNYVKINEEIEEN